MRFPAYTTFVSALLFTFITSPVSRAQQLVSPVSTDPQTSTNAMQILKKAALVMGGSPPADTTATGTIIETAGTDQVNGTIKILTKSTEQTLEEISLPKGLNRVAYSHRAAAILTPTSEVPDVSMERALSSQSPIFPLPILAQILTSPDSGYDLIGSEDIDGISTVHIRTWNTFNSHPKTQVLSEFTNKDIWVEVQSQLVRKMSFEIRDAKGAAPRTSIDVYYSDYRDIGGSLYPFDVRESMNGTPWLKITIQNVHANAGLTDSAFQIQ
jgi:hypothetical protein